MPTSSRSDRRARAAGLLAAVLLFGSAGGLVAWRLAPGDTDPGPADADAAGEVAIDYVGAAFEGDCDRFSALSTGAATLQTCRRFGAMLGEGQSADIRAADTDTTLRGDDAEVVVAATVTRSRPAGEAGLTEVVSVVIGLVREDGRWLVDRATRMDVGDGTDGGDG